MKSIGLRTLLLIACLWIQYKSIGQKDTTIIKENDSLVSVPKNVAILITKDLLKKDILEEEVAYLKQDTTLLLKSIQAYKKDSALQKLKEQAQLSVITSLNKTIVNCEEYAMKQQRKLKVSKAKTTISQLALLVTSVLLISRL